MTHDEMNKAIGKIMSQNQDAKVSEIETERFETLKVMDRFCRTFSGRPFAQNPQTYADVKEPV